MQSILVCENDKQIVEAIDIYLTGEGFDVIKAYDGAEALELLKTHTVNLMILDVMMPGLDGIRTTLKVRETSSIPIIILSAKSEDADKILGLNIGADDYITKPFNPLELVARVKSQLRRYTQLGNMNNQMGNHVFKCGPVRNPPWRRTSDPDPLHHLRCGKPDDRMGQHLQQHGNRPFRRLYPPDQRRCKVGLRSLCTGNHRSGLQLFRCWTV